MLSEGHWSLGSKRTSNLRALAGRLQHIDLAQGRAHDVSDVPRCRKGLEEQAIKLLVRGSVRVKRERNVNAWPCARLKRGQLRNAHIYISYCKMLKDILFVATC